MGNNTEKRTSWNCHLNAFARWFSPEPCFPGPDLLLYGFGLTLLGALAGLPFGVLPKKVSERLSATKPARRSHGEHPLPEMNTQFPGVGNHRIAITPKSVRLGKGPGEIYHGSCDDSRSSKVQIKHKILTNAGCEGFQS